MKYIFNLLKAGGLAGFIALAVSSCNKGLSDIGGTGPVSPVTNSSLKATGDTLGTAARANDSLFYRMVVKGGMLATLNNKAVNYTVFVPTNAAMRVFITAASGGLVPAGAPDAVFSGFITANLPAASAAGIVSYNIIPQRVLSTDIPATFPNFQYPTLINPAPTVSALLRLTTFPSTRNGSWVNNTPIISLDNLTGNGVFHEIANVVTPPGQYLWDRINADTTLTYLKAAILRADSGVAITSATSLQGALLNIGANLTVYAPTDSTFKVTLTGAIYQGLLPQVVAQLVPIITAQLIPVITAQLITAGATPEDAAAQAPALAAAQAPAIAAAQAPAIAYPQAQFLASSPTVFSNPALYGALSSQTVKGIVVYHILGVRAFNNNLPTTAANFPTLLNGAIPTHPGIGLKASLAGSFVIGATVQGAYNATPANVYINPTPAPFGTSDQFYLNGVLQKIDQVLIPLPL